MSLQSFNKMTFGMNPASFQNRQTFYHLIPCWEKLCAWKLKYSQTIIQSQQVPAKLFRNHDQHWLYHHKGELYWVSTQKQHYTQCPWCCLLIYVIAGPSTIVYQNIALRFLYSIIIIVFCYHISNVSITFERTYKQ